MVQFDYDSIRNRLIERLRSKESWNDILFYSTNSRLIDIFAEELAYNMQMNEIYATECKWTLAKQISSILSEVKFFNYYPHRKIGASGYVRFSTSKTFSSSYPRAIEISRFTTCSTPLGVLVCVSETTSMSSAANYVDVPVIQGTPKETVFIASGDEYEQFTIINASIDNSVYDVIVNNEIWYPVESIREAETATSKVYVLENLTDFSGVTITFGNDYFGKKLSAGDIVTFKYVETDGDKGNIESLQTVTTVASTLYDSAGDEVDMYCTNLDAITGGRSYEDIEDIRVKAPKTYQSGNRAISKSDYKSILESFSFVSKANCWGEAEVNADLGNLPGTFIAAEENVVHVSAISSSGESVSTEQQLTIRETLNEKKSPSDIVVFEDVNFIKLKFNITAYVADKKYSLTNVVAAIIDSLESQYSVNSMEFKKPIRYSDYVSLIDNVTGVDYHDTTIEYYKEELFNTAYSADLTPEIYSIKPGSVKIYARNTSQAGSGFFQIAYDDGTGSLVGSSGYTVTASSINYNTGIGAIIVETGLTENYANYLLRVYFETTVQNIIPTKRYQIVSYGEAEVDAEYED